MRYIKTTNNYVEFIEADDSQNILSVRGFQFGELYFQIKNGKVTFYLNDQENPWRNDVWTINIPFELDGELYEDEDSAAAALEAIINDKFQEQLDKLKEDLADEVTRSTAKDAEHDAEISGLTDGLNNEIARAISAETEIANDLDQEIADRIADVDAEEARAFAAESALTDALNDEITRSTAKDAEHDAEISGLTTSLQNEINRAVGAENSLRDDLNDEVSARTSAESAMVQRITALEVGKADKSDVYTKAESDNKYATKEYVSGNTYTKAEIATMMADKADKLNAVSTALYNSQNKTIDFKNIYGNVIASVDARDFIKDGMVQNAIIRDNNLVITFNTDAGKEDIVVPLTDIFDPSNYYTKTETDEAIADAIDDIDLSDYYTKLEVDASQLAQDNKINAISGKVDTISGDVQTLSGNVQTLSGSAITSGEVQTMIDEAVSGKTIDYLSAGTNVQITDNVISATDTKYTGTGSITVENKVISLNVPIWHGNNVSTSVKENYATNIASGSYSHAEGYNTKSSGAYSHAEGYGTNAIGFASHAEGESTASGAYSHSQGYGSLANGEASHAGGYSVTTKNRGEFASGKYNISNSGTSDAVKTLFSVGNGQTNETKHNAFEIKENGDIYISSGGTTSSPMIKLQDHLGGGGGGGVTPTEVQTMIDNSLVGYQEELTAGTNVQINNNVISATDTKYTAGDGIDITNNVISTVTKFWCGTQSQYDAISVKDPNTVYMIHE